jgi:hypothetical protein
MFTIDKPRAIGIAKGMKKLKLTWSYNARISTMRQRAPAVAGGL